MGRLRDEWKSQGRTKKVVFFLSEPEMELEPEAN
jgi:hypothetical protein